MPVREPTTWIKLDRNLTDWRWFRNPKTLQVWIWLLLKANIRPRDFEKETVDRGQLVTSRKTIVAETGLSDQEVRTALDHLKSTGEIVARQTSKYQVITLVNYELYQGSAAAKQPEESQQTTGSQSTIQPTIQPAVQPTDNQESTGYQPADKQLETAIQQVFQPPDNPESTGNQPAGNQQTTSNQPAGNRQSTGNQPAINQQSTGNQPQYKNERIKDIKEGKKGEKGCGARIPSLGEVAAYVAAEGLRVDAADFVDYYAACDWKIRGSPIVNWQALARKWSRNEERKHSPGEAAEPLSVKRNHEGRVRE